MDKVLNVERLTGKSPYRQIHDHLSRLIKQGTLSPGSKLPTVREMMRTYGVSSNTVQKALRHLKASLLVRGRPGSGLYVPLELPSMERDSSLELWVTVPKSLLGQFTGGAVFRGISAKYPQLRVVNSTVGNDVIWMDSVFLPQHDDCLEDITDLVLEAYGREHEGAEVFDHLRVNGRILILPGAINVGVMACNVDVFQRLGVPLPREGWGWDEFRQTASALTRKDEGSYGYVVNAHWDSFISWIWQAGGALFSKDGTRCLLDRPPAVEAARFIRSLGDVSVLGDPDRYQRQHELFVSGRSAMMQIGVGGYDVFNEAGCNWVSRQLPSGQQRATWRWAWGFGLNRRPAPHDMGHAFIRDYADLARSSECARLVGLPLHKAFEQDCENQRAYRQALTLSRCWLSDIEPEYRKPKHYVALTNINRYMGLLLHGDQPVEQLMRDLSLDIELSLSASEGNLMP